MFHQPSFYYYDSQSYYPQVYNLPPPVYNPQMQYYQLVQNPTISQDKANTYRHKIAKKRTRTGCLTCRKRHIKCDERKPGCSNCERSKKRCLGYEDLTKPKRKRDTSLDLDCSDGESIKLEQEYPLETYITPSPSNRELHTQTNSEGCKIIHPLVLPSPQSIEEKILSPDSQIPKRTSVEFLIT